MPRSEIFDDIYFSPKDGRGESAHVFLQGNQLPDKWQNKSCFTIAECGFGTGLNFLMSAELFAESAPEEALLEYIAFEQYPLEKEMIRQALQAFELPHLDLMLSQYPQALPGWHRLNLTPHISLMLIFGDVNQEISRLSQPVDAWFLDGFAPAKNPQMWTPLIFENMARLSRTGATFATFTAAGFVKRGLADAGFNVCKVPGFGHKRDMLRGDFP